MREIKVRGYAVDEMIGSQWIIGTGVHTIVFTDKYFEETGKKYEHFVFGEYGWVEVHGESIGQYTGLMDKNGTEICEGDIVATNKGNSVICFDTPQARYKVVPISLYLANAGSGGWTGFDMKYAEKVIGNIYENPELLEVTE